MEHEAELLAARAANVLVHHAPIGVEGADGRVLATDEGEANGTVIVVCWGCQRASDTACVAALVDEATIAGIVVVRIVVKAPRQQVLTEVVLALLGVW